MKYIVMNVIEDSSKKEYKQCMFVFPDLINHDDMADVIMMCILSKFDGAHVQSAGFIRELEAGSFNFACHGRSESLDIDGSLHDCKVINGRNDEYTICKITGVVDKYIASISNDGLPVTNTTTFTFIIPNLFDSQEMWEELKYVKIGHHRDWSRPFRSWQYELIKP